MDKVKIPDNQVVLMEVIAPRLSGRRVLRHQAGEFRQSQLHPASRPARPARLLH